KARPLGLLERGRRWLKREPLLAGVTVVALLALLAAVLVPLGSALWLAAAVQSQEGARQEWLRAMEGAELAGRDALAQHERARSAQARAREATALLTRESSRAHYARTEAATKAEQARQNLRDAEAR